MTVTRQAANKEHNPMQHRASTPKKYLLILLGALALNLACGWLARQQEQDRQRELLATGAALIGEGSHLAADSYRRLKRLPVYQLESHTLLRSSAGQVTTHTTISRFHHDDMHLLTQTPGGPQDEFYFVEGHTYTFAAQYGGWIDLGPVTPAEAYQNGQLAFWNPEWNPVPLLTQLGAVPILVGQETLHNRPVTRYELQYVLAEIAEQLGQPSGSPPVGVRGSLWIDDETGVLLKATVLFYENQADQPTRQYSLAVSQLGSVSPIGIPTPVVDPAASAAATATAQARSVLKARLTYGGEPITFEMIPLSVTAVPDTGDPQAQMQLILRQLPPDVLEAAEPFLAQLQQQLQLSIPRRNLAVTSSDFRLQNSDPQQHQLNVLYFFAADLEDFNQVELIFTQPGNPLFVPVPVE